MKIPLQSIRGKEFTKNKLRYLMELSTLGSGLTAAETVLEFKFGLTGRDMKVIGKMIRPMGRASCIMRMVMSMKVGGRMIELMVWAATFMQMELLIKETGKTTNNMERVWKLGQMEPVTKANTWMAKKKASAHFSFLMVHSIQESSGGMKLMGRGYIGGLMERSMMENGRQIRCTAMEY
jgi:hypothetical protein